MKRILKPYIEMLSNEKLKEYVRDGLEKIPEYFWEIPASSSGNYHPYYDSGIGGTVRHTAMTIVCALDLIRMEYENPDPILIDMTIVACTFHDTFKNGTDDSGNTIFEHPYLARDFVLNHFLEYDISFAVEVSNAVFSHMGRWNTHKSSDTILRYPTTPLDKIVHTADYVASRKYTIYMP